MNRKIFLKSYTIGKTAGGGPIKTLANNYEQWAEVEEFSESQNASESQGLYETRMRFEFRAYPSRNITSQFYIEYEEGEYKINSLKKNKEGKLFKWIAEATKVDNV